jgi:heterodisulfide reductase subunit A-like polyferredoxin
MSPIATSSSSSSNSSSDTAPNGNDSSNTSVATDSTEVIKPVIAIIGAGVSGLKAAQVLLDKGYEVVIYEARDRAGGRTCTSDRLGKEVDL